MEKPESRPIENWLQGHVLNPIGKFYLLLRGSKVPTWHIM